MRTTHLPSLLKLTACISLTWFTANAFAAPSINGNSIEVPDDGWYQVQRSDNFESICEGQLSCDVTPGNYIVINHTTGERFDVSVNDSADSASSVDSVDVTGNTISWPDDGWYQVQSTSNYASVCEGGRRCEVPNGEYVVINHTTGQREIVSVGGETTTTPGSDVQIDPNELVAVVGNTIYWRNDGWYQVQNATTFESLCEGDSPCAVSNGTYVVINHTTGQRDNNVTVLDDTSVTSPVTAPVETTPTAFDMVAPQVMPANCIGSLDNQNTRFCVNPDTRLFSATDVDGTTQWSFTLPGTNASNQIETVLTTDQWLIIVADKFPEQDVFTPNERANQYEASLFNKDGSFVRTVPLTFDLEENSPFESANINSRFFSGALNNPLLAIASESDSGNPLLVVGWNRWTNGDGWDLGGVAQFDLASGIKLISQIFVEDGIQELSLVKADRDMVRIVSDNTITWRYINQLEVVQPSHFSQFAQDAPIQAIGSVDSQLNGSNYQDVINRVLPWINGDVANDMLFGSVSDEPPRTFAIPFNEFNLLSQFDDDDYTNSNYQCSNGGEVLNRDLRIVPITKNVLDHCAFGDRTYNGKLSGNYVGRTGFGVAGENLTLFRNDNSITSANLGHSVSLSRVARGSNRSYFGSMAGYGESAHGNNISVANYRTAANFFYGRTIGVTDTCAAEVDSNGQFVTRLFCQENNANGNIRANFSLNAEWTTYSTLLVSTTLSFGQRYFTDFSWLSTNGTSLPDPIPFDGRTEPLKDFYFESGLIQITAQDQSRIELTPIAEVGEPMFNVRVYDPNGNELGNFPMEFVNIKCVERLGDCTVP